VDTKIILTYIQKSVELSDGGEQLKLIAIDPRAAQKIQSELMSGESIYWAGMPNPRVVLHSDDWAMIPFSLVWTGFFIFWEADALGYWRDKSHQVGTHVFMVLWGIPFLVMGNYIVWGRFLHDAWLKRRTYYGVTNRRLLVLQEGWHRKTSTTFLVEIPQIEREGASIGTLWFGTKYPVIVPRGQKSRAMSRFSLGDVPVFADIADVDTVHRLIMDLRAKIDPRPSSKPALTYSTRR
jgi:hypothetical protein